MLEFPIARREMLVAARSPALYRGRLVASIVVLLAGIGFAILYEYVGMSGAMPILGVLSFILLQICLFAGAQATADSLSREKREGTIGLLFLTTLKPWEITFSKLVSNGLMMFYGVIICLPLFSLGMIAGGVALGDVFDVGIAALNTLFVSMAIGLFASSRNEERRKSARTAVWIIMIFWMGIPALTTFIASLRPPPFVLAIVSLFNFGIPRTVGFGGRAGPMAAMGIAPSGSWRWISVATMHLLGWFFIWLATFNLKRRWQDNPPKKRRRIRDWWKNLNYGNGPARALHRKRLLDVNPFFWLASRNLLAKFWVWLPTLLLPAFIYVVVGRNTGFIPALIMLTLGVSVLHKGMVGGKATVQLAAENEQGTLEMILSSPLTTREIIKGQLLAIWRTFRLPIILVLIVQWFAVVFLKSFSDQSIPPGAWIGMAAYSGMYLLDLWTLAWLGMWSATTSTEPKKAPGITLLKGILLPGYIMGFLGVLYAMANWLFSLTWQPPVWLMISLWFVIGLLNDVFWLRRVQKRLPLEIRKLPFRKYAPQEPAWSFFNLFTSKKVKQPAASF